MASLQPLVSVSIVVALAYLALVSVTAVTAALRAGGRREDALDAQDTVAASRLTMPVSIVVPVESSPDASRIVHALLDLDYPEFEVIAVVAAPAAEIASLTEEWKLEAREFFYRRTLETAPVRRIFRSVRDERLMVVEKEADDRADALNCGVNLARYRFVAVVPPGVTFDRAALLRAMSPALQDPASVVGVGSHVERVPVDRASADREARFQRLRSIRGLMFARLFWGQLRNGLGPEDDVVIWRRDAVLQANGFSKRTGDADLDMMFRLQDGVGAEGRRFVRNAEPFGHAATRPAEDDRAAVRRRQRTAMQMLATWGPGAVHSVGLRTFGHFLESEFVTPLAQIWVVVASLLGAAAGWYSWPAVALAIVGLSFGTAVVSAAALLVRGAHPGAPAQVELKALLLLAPLEVLLQGPRLAAARLAAVKRRPDEPIRLV